MDYHDIGLLLRSHSPILVLETHEETRAIEMMMDISLKAGSAIFRSSNPKT